MSSVLVIGEALVDVVHSGDGGIKNVPGGSPANTAVALARLGITTFMKARISKINLVRKFDHIWKIKMLI